MTVFSIGDNCQLHSGLFEFFQNFSNTRVYFDTFKLNFVVNSAAIFVELFTKNALVSKMVSYVFVTLKSVLPAQEVLQQLVNFIWPF